MDAALDSRGICRIAVRAIVPDPQPLRPGHRGESSDTSPTNRILGMAGLGGRMVFKTQLLGQVFRDIGLTNILFRAR